MFVVLAPEVYRQFRQLYAVHQPDPLEPVVRFVCSWATTEREVDDVINAVAEAHS